MLRLSLSDSALMVRSLVVPCVTTTVLFLRSLYDLILEDFLTTSLVPVMKVTGANATSFWRVRLLVVEPHSRSTVPLDISGMRVCEVTGLYFTVRLVICSVFFTSSTTAAHK